MNDEINTAFHVSCFTNQISMAAVTCSNLDTPPDITMFIAAVLRSAVELISAAVLTSAAELKGQSY
jgi:hypothetical protein